MKKLTLMIAVLLAGCGGSGEVVVSSPGQDAGPFPDAFIAEVTRVVEATPENSEAAAIDNMAAASAPEDKESITL